MKNLVYILALFILSLSCSDKKKDIEILSKKPKQSKEAKQEKVIESVYQTESFIVWGDSTIDETKIYSSSQKFEPFIYFDDFNVPVEKNKKAKLNLKSNKQGGMFQTNIQNAYANENANFAGHYTFVYWGCGSACAMSKVIDRRDGKIYDSPQTMLGYDFRANSRLLVVNPPDSTGYYENSYLSKPEIYIFNESTKKFIERKGGLQ